MADSVMPVTKIPSGEPSLITVDAISSMYVPSLKEVVLDLPLSNALS